MSLEGIEHYQEDGPEANHAPSYALDALSELHTTAMASLAPESSLQEISLQEISSQEISPRQTSSAEVSSAGASPAQAASAETSQVECAPESHPQAQAEQKPEGEKPLESLQSALDWYKDWLSSM